MRRVMRTNRWMVASVLLGLACQARSADAPIAPQGSEYSLPGHLAGDQAHPHLSLGGSGGYLVWDDNATDGAGRGIGAVRLNANLSPALGAMRINEIAEGDQEQPQAALLPNGGAVFVWQGGAPGFQKIYARFMGSDQAFLGGDIQVNVYVAQQQVNPAVAALADGTVVVVWSSHGQDGSLQGIFGRQFSESGQPLGGEFQVSQTTSLNQRNPAVAALAGGGFVVAWINERFMGYGPQYGPDGLPFNSMGLPYPNTEQYGFECYGRLYGSGGQALGNELRLSEAGSFTANPAVAGFPTGGFLCVWSQKFQLDTDRNWDVCGRVFNANGTPASLVKTLNTHTYGDQFGPRVAAVGTEALVVWTSLLQDGSWEGVFGQYVDGQAELAGGELQVNTTVLSRQIHPSVAADARGRLLAVWSGVFLEAGDFDLFAQRYASALPLDAPAAPYVAPVKQGRLSVTWPPLSGYVVDHYELYMDGSQAPIVVAGNRYLASQLLPGTAHTFRLLYQLDDGRRSPVSEAASGKTWDEDDNGDGLPDDWQARYWGAQPAAWPRNNDTTDSDGDGASNLQEFLAGTAPNDPASVLRTRWANEATGSRLIWNTQPGFVYQVQVAAEFAEASSDAWSDFGLPRLAPESTDSVAVQPGQSQAYYRVIRLW